MKRKILVFCTMGVLVGCAVFGGIKRKTYTDIKKNENYLDELHVAVLTEEFAEAGCEQLIEAAASAPIVVQAEAVEELEHTRGISRQKVKITNTYKGDCGNKDDEIFIYSNRWSLVLRDEPKSIERGFVNMMDVGETYLLFLLKETEDFYTDTPVYELYEDTLIAPVFGYKSKTNTPVKAAGEHTYIRYSDVKDNEIFVQTKEAVAIWEETKREIFETYPL